MIQSSLRSRLEEPLSIGTLISKMYNDPANYLSPAEYLAGWYWQWKLYPIEDEL